MLLLGRTQRSCWHREAAAVAAGPGEGSAPGPASQRVRPPSLCPHSVTLGFKLRHQGLQLGTAALLQAAQAAALELQQAVDVVEVAVQRPAVLLLRLLQVCGQGLWRSGWGGSAVGPGAAPPAPRSPR